MIAVDQLTVTVAYAVPEGRLLDGVMDHALNEAIAKDARSVSVECSADNAQLILEGRLDQVVAVSAAVLFGSVQEALSYAVEQGQVLL